ncbi:hypothetical protein Nepgr_012896 [Nepenthes gracilis]|uniref:Uncharacterized protein n=1 Tax=Nepenthes gracilis TaxID=150966 RepID=A0AAD3XNT0_NEPGR|nr:hypothetical protein Nepgr_012896 [Nepenthes gracilis]
MTCLDVYAEMRWCVENCFFCQTQNGVFDCGKHVIRHVLFVFFARLLHQKYATMVTMAIPKGRVRELMNHKSNADDRCGKPVMSVLLDRTKEETHGVEREERCSLMGDACNGIHRLDDEQCRGTAMLQNRDIGLCD